MFVGAIQTKRRVLVVGNDGADRGGWGEALHRAGIDTVLEGSLERALCMAAELRPRGVIVDLAMEGCDPLQLATALRAHPRTRDLAIVAITHAVTDDVLELARSRGCDAVLARSAKPHAIAAVIARLLDRPRARAA
ncbi:hypothetical protein DB32_003308 [Sandaracinus amylolyticus]|uniref:Response regulatory domain-containing protein n=1 Tax=Sandaracinus amylolyticus TaxID=927083 RepID=A0A0F6SF16_9BACT|nr:hypothetical protein DB32_003308 [Sandaracinus amylolyticus]